MASALYDIVCDQGATFVRNVSWLDEDETPINLWGYTARMQVRATVQAATPLVSLTTENGGIVLTPETGGIRLFLTDAQTDALPARKAVYDLEMVSGTGVVTRLLQGTFTIVPQVTR
jgi:hypothetical protein